MKWLEFKARPFQNSVFAANPLTEPPPRTKARNPRLLPYLVGLAARKGEQHGFADG